LENPENPAFAPILIDSFQSVRNFVEIFWECVLEVIIFLSPKFELLWTCFDRSFIEFWFEPRKPEVLGSG